MQALANLLRQNADPSDTRYNILSEAEIEEIEDHLECEPILEQMRESYERRHPVEGR